MLYDKNSYVVNTINFALSKRLLISKLKFSKKTLKLIKILAKSGVLKNFFITSSTPKYIYFSIFFYKNTTFFKHVRLISTQTKKFYISLNAIKKLTKVMRTTVLILETSKGLLTNVEALRYKTGGILLLAVN
jgi:ribosomal protein S8